jgi:hypothetical protein
LKIILPFLDTKLFNEFKSAQKHGLLSDPVPQGAELEADPFYAACKLHTNRETSKYEQIFNIKYQYQNA